MNNHAAKHPLYRPLLATIYVARGFDEECRDIPWTELAQTMIDQIKEKIWAETNSGTSTLEGIRMQTH
jgi:hypothetical protein